MKQQHMQKGNKKERMGKLKELGLSKDQMAQLKTQRQANKAKMESIKSDQSLTDDQKKAQMKILKESNMESFKSVLTPEQLNKLETEKTNK